jgi:2-hydroxychromene-2-carboxylate isomerase
MQVTAYFDFASPWAWVAWNIAPKKLPGITIDWQPIYLRGLETFAKGLPYTSNKLDYLMKDLQRVAKHEGVPLAPPASFPIDGLTMLRASLVAKEKDAFERFTTMAFRATWAESKPIADKTFVASLLGEAIGASGPDALALTAAPHIKDALRDATAVAEKRGVFGVPTYVVGDELFWGNEKLDYVLRAAAP